MEYSRGMPTIPEDSFGRLLLRNTSLEEEEIQKYLNRLCSRLKQRKVGPLILIFFCGKNAESCKRCRCMKVVQYTMFVSYLMQNVATNGNRGDT